MSSDTTRQFLEGHRTLRNQVERLLLAAQELPHLDPEPRIELVEEIVTFLAQVLLPHADAEQRVLYPEARRLLGGVDETDSIDHDRSELRRRITELVECDPDDAGRLQELVYAIYALLSIHFWKKEEIFLRLLGSQPAASVSAVLDKLAERERSLARRRFRRSLVPSGAAPAAH